MNVNCDHINRGTVSSDNLLCRVFISVSFDNHVV